MLVPRVMLGSGLRAFYYTKGPDGVAAGVRALQDEAQPCLLPAEGHDAERMVHLALGRSAPRLAATNLPNPCK